MLYDVIKKYRCALRFHTPGAKGRVYKYDKTLEWGIPADLLELDITELEYSDNLLIRAGILKVASENAANYFGADKCFFITSGATTAILSAVYSFKRNDGVKAKNNGGGTTGGIFISKNSHISVYNAIEITGLNSIIIDSCVDNYANGVNNADKVSADSVCASNGYSDLPTLEQIESAFKRHKGVKVLLLTSPNYYGKVLDIKSIYALCKKYSVTFILDAAHGAHFKELAGLKVSDLIKNPTQYSDICILSAHKTLPVLTGGAFLNVSERADYTKGLVNRVDASLKKFHTTSPSYPCLITLDLSIHYLQSKGAAAYASLFQRVSALKQRLDKLKHIKVLDTDDFTRLVLKTKCAKALESHLVANRIYPELTDLARVVFIITPADTESELDTLYSVLEAFDIARENDVRESVTSTTASHDNTSVDNTGVDNIAVGKGDLDLIDALGKTSVYNVGIYPPATPVILKGEVVTKKHIKILSQFKGRIYGLQNGKIAVYDSIEH
ncbi:MAG: beta-eliminating lyase-related protein [Firmicutes bacterium]|nr:beta-eliminating lyase-related protein [Bacillota bacterium]